jgi:hypothetical protein
MQEDTDVLEELATASTRWPDQIVYRYIDDPCFDTRVKAKWVAGGNDVLRMSAGFRREIDENCALLDYYGATSGSGIFYLLSAYTTAIFWTWDLRYLNKYYTNGCI